MPWWLPSKKAMTRRFIAFALAFLLGFAQHAAFAHAIEHHAPVSHGDGHDPHHDHAGHARDAHGEPRVQAGHDRPPAESPDGAHANCALDALYVQVLGAAGTAAGPFLLTVPEHRPAAVSPFRSAPPAAVLAAAPRGPPAAPLPL